MDNKRQMEKSALTQSKISPQPGLPYKFQTAETLRRKEGLNAACTIKNPLRLCVFAVHFSKAFEPGSPVNLQSSI